MSPGTDADDSAGGDRASEVAIGAGTGAALGGLGGFLVGLGALAIPGIGPVLAAGPIAAALAGVGLGAAAGGVIGALTELGIPEDDAHVTRWRQAGWPGFDPAAEPLGVVDGLRIGVPGRSDAAGAMETESKVGQPVTESGVHGGIRGTSGHRGARAYHAPAGDTRRRSDAA